MKRKRPQSEKKSKNQSRRRQALFMMLAVLAVCSMPLMDKGLKHYTRIVLERNAALESEGQRMPEESIDKSEETTDETNDRETEPGTDDR